MVARIRVCGVCLEPVASCVCPLDDGQDESTEEDDG